MHMGNFCPTIKALKRSIKVSLEALIFMSMVYLNDFSGAAYLGKNKNISLVKICITRYNYLALIFMWMVYLNDSSEAANLGKDENNQLVKKNSIAPIIMPVVNLDWKWTDYSSPGVRLQNVPSVGREAMHLQVSFWLGPQTPCLEHCVEDQTYWFSHLHWVLFEFERQAANATNWKGIGEPMFK